MRKEEHIAFVSFGEGSSNQGDVHEAFNFAGVFKLPVIFLCENNQYAISIPAHRQVAGRVVDRAAGYGFPGQRVDGNDALDVYRAVKEARERAVRGYGPTLIEAMMYRIPPHSTADDDMLYRTKEEVEYHKEQDGVQRFRRYLLESDVLSEELDRALQENIAKEVNEATKYAEKSPYPARRTCCGMCMRKMEVMFEMPIITYLEAIRSAMAEEMERDDCVFVLGEDIGKGAS